MNLCEDLLYWISYSDVGSRGRLNGTQASHAKSRASQKIGDEIRYHESSSICA